jgi:CheY-like chemotaxis protein
MSLVAERTEAVHAVALTAHARNEDKALALAAGFEMHIAKPGPAELPEILAGLMDRSRRPNHVPV